MITHTLTTAQLRKLVDAFEDSDNWPEMTDDPRVNYAMVCVTSDYGDEPQYDEELYTAEATKASRAHAQRRQTNV